VEEEVDIPPTITPVVLPEIGTSFVKLTGSVTLTPDHGSVINNGTWVQLLKESDYFPYENTENLQLHNSTYQAFLKMARDFKASTKGNLEGDKGDQLVVELAALRNEAYTAADEKYRAGNLIKLKVSRLDFTWSADHGGMYSYTGGDTINKLSTNARVQNAITWLSNYAASYGFIGETGTTVNTFRYVGVGMANALRLLRSEDSSKKLDDLIALLKTHTQDNTYRIKDKNLNTTYEMWFIRADGDGNATALADPNHTTVYYYTGDGYIACVASR
jgi:hypothetical protein